MNRWIYTESIGRGEFSIADTTEGLKFVWLDKHGIANIFNLMEDFMQYLEGDLSCDRICVEPYDTGFEGIDFIDDYLKIEE